jgi:hypothetical protein
MIILGGQFFKKKKKKFRSHNILGETQERLIASQTVIAIITSRKIQLFILATHFFIPTTTDFLFY